MNYMILLVILLVMTSLSLISSSKFKILSWKTISVFAKKYIPSLSFDKYKGNTNLYIDII